MVIGVQYGGDCSECCFDYICNLGKENKAEQFINGVEYNCSGDDVIYKEVKEKDMDEMPELKAGMIVELYNELTDDNYGLYLYINKDWTISLSKNEWCGINDDVKVIGVRKADAKTWSSLGRANTLQWSKQSPEDKKISEIEKTIESMNKEHNKNIKELKEQVQELKSGNS
jgi:hypothetical protein